QPGPELVSPQANITGRCVDLVSLKSITNKNRSLPYILGSAVALVSNNNSKAPYKPPISVNAETSGNTFEYGSALFDRSNY
ncbi:hypothetical protein IJZ97_05680, partial [bacterium]|nr:hypothetical protein [bacterium]